MSSENEVPDVYEYLASHQFEDQVRMVQDTFIDAQTEDPFSTVTLKPYQAIANLKVVRAEALPVELLLTLKEGAKGNCLA